MSTYTITISFAATLSTPSSLILASGGLLESKGHIAQRLGIDVAQSVRRVQMERGGNVSRTGMVWGFTMAQGLRPEAEQV